MPTKQPDKHLLPSLQPGLERYPMELDELGLLFCWRYDIRLLGIYRIVHSSSFIQKGLTIPKDQVKLGAFVKEARKQGKKPIFTLG